MNSITNTITPIFIFSLPRSGSTLLQKIIASSDKVSTTSEPWILLPLLHMRKENGMLTEYSHKICQKALDDLEKELLQSHKTILDRLQSFALEIYKDLSEADSIYFLDKTPRYYLIIKEIAALFPEAKFIFLFRNPMAQYASKINIHNGRFKTLNSVYVDLNKGPSLLADGYEEFADRSIKITYDELVNSSDAVIDKIQSYLNIKINTSILQNLSIVKLKGGMGDPSLIKNESSKISETSLGKWKFVFNSPLRRLIAVSYLKGIADNYFLQLGVSRNDILKELRGTKIKYFAYPKDYFDLIYFYVNAYFKPYLIFSKRNRWAKNIYLN